MPAIHLIRDHDLIAADEVARAIQCDGTAQTCVNALGDPSNNVTTFEAHVRYAEALGRVPHGWFYSGAGKVADGSVRIDGPLCMQQAEAGARVMNEYVARRKKKGENGACSVSIWSEPGKDWEDAGVTPDTFNGVVNDIIAMLAPDVAAAVCLTPLKGAPAPARWLKNNARIVGAHLYGYRCWKEGHAAAVRWADMRKLLKADGRPVIIDEAGLIDEPDICGSGSTPYDDYHAHLLETEPAYFDGRLMGLFLSSNRWKGYPNWMDGRWAQSFDPVAGAMTYPGAPAWRWGHPGNRAVIEPTRQQVWSANIVRAPLNKQYLVQDVKAIHDAILAGVEPDVAKLASSPFGVAQ